MSATTSLTIWRNSNRLLARQVSLLSASDGVVQCGAPNLSFLASLHVSTSRLPQPAPHADLDRSKVHCHY